MKKYNVFKILLIVLLVSIVASFIIPGSTMSYTGIEKGSINPITLIDSVSNGLTSFSVFIASFVFILSIGIFYTILKKTSKYEAVINNTACKFKNNKKIFLIISILTFGLLTAIIGDVMPMLILVPAFIDVAKKLGYDSKKAILSTVGAIILGSAGSLYTNYTNQILSTTVSSNIIPKIIILVISLLSLILFAILGKKPENVNLEKVDVKARSISIAFDVILILILLGMIPWMEYFGFEGFSNFHKTITEFQVFKVSLYNAFIGGTIPALGEWSIYVIIVVVLFTSVIISLVNKLKIDDIFESFAAGIKKAIPYAMILILSNLILVGVYNSGFYNTVISSIAKMKDSILSTTTISALSGIVYPDYTYANQFTLSLIAATISKSTIFVVVAVIFQAIYSLMLLISPTSILILMALKYEQVSYKSWIKYIYKLFLGLLIVFFVIFMILGNKYIKIVSFIVLVVLVLMFVLSTVLCRGKKLKKKETKREEKIKEDEEVVVKQEKKTTETKKVGAKKTTKKKIKK